ncbi:NUDIX domain-containing protein [Mycobacterium asiaticum]|uniref:ADP-ribose pyrophosphatase n=1 Tax=Mycobacterium asiaticum TaxID=1790 RepID=A0A1A3KDP0_MYCAS|nr:NUDIX hydrolase [Mycobacterium asiaticum]OBJ83150.1 ADP-ribose pyrophosphatase [Mycobacterium asiaticum]ORA11252.1 ADP-ribose pyrophosphatase [Mycobacterium asiaticum DSM 44297]
MAEHDFQTVSSETLYQGAIFALRRDQVKMPGGNVAKREVLEHYGAVAIVALNDASEVALVYQYRHTYRRRIWELPAGLLDAPGEPPHHTAVRELEEEVGLRADTWQVLLDVNTAPGYSDESVRVYLATGLTDIGRPEAHDEEADMTMQWFPLAKAVELVMNGEIVNSIAIAGILAAHAVRSGNAEPRPLDTPWIDKPAAFAKRKAGQ